MSMLVGYDLRAPRAYHILDHVLGNTPHEIDGLFEDGINLPNGPRFVAPHANVSTLDVLGQLKVELDARHPNGEDRLLVVEIGERGAQRNLPERCRQWLAEHGLRLDGDRRPGQRAQGGERPMLAIAYTARIPAALHRIPGSPSWALELERARHQARRQAEARRRRMREAIAHLGRLGTGGALHPVDSLWLVETDLSPASVRDRLTPLLSADDEILVVEVHPATAVRTLNLGWFERKRLSGMVAEGRIATAARAA